jgi:uncharacterized protein with HEPN domain
MSKDYRLPDYLEHIQQAATEACGDVEGMSKEEFLKNKLIQKSVILSLIIIGEAVTKIMTSHAEFINAHAEIAWREIRGMRNQMVHGYFSIDLDTVWMVTQRQLPDLLNQLSDLIRDAETRSSD